MGEFGFSGVKQHTLRTNSKKESSVRGLRKSDNLFGDIIYTDAGTAVKVFINDEHRVLILNKSSASIKGRKDFFSYNPRTKQIYHIYLIEPCRDHARKNVHRYRQGVKVKGYITTKGEFQVV